MPVAIVRPTTAKKETRWEKTCFLKAGFKVPVGSFYSKFWKGLIFNQSGSNMGKKEFSFFSLLNVFYLEVSWSANCTHSPQALVRSFWITEIPDRAGSQLCPFQYKKLP
jgi:hypothetical protein